jgi:hypothetical protein
MPYDNSQVRLALALETLTRVKAEVDAAIESIRGHRNGPLPLGDNTERLMQMAPPDDELLARVQASVSEIAGSVDNLTRRQSAQIDQLRKVSYATAVGVLLHVPLTIVTIILFFIASNATDAANEATAEVREVQDRTSKDVLCPLYDLFLTSYNPRGATALRDPAGYERSIVTIEHGATVLGCAHRTRGKQN